MQTPTSQTPVARLVAAARFLLAALAQMEATADLAPALRATLDLLVSAIAATAAADEATVQPRVTLRFAERDAEQTIRMLANAARGLDNGKAGGRVLDALFPDGVNAVIAPRAEQQHAALGQLQRRLAGKDVAASLRSEHEPAIQRSLDALRRCIDARDAALVARDAAFQRELAARDEVLRAYDSVANAIRSRFPKDRPQQDMFFETLRTPSKSDAAQEPPAPATPERPS
jgi:hypothetical protein